MSLPPYAVKVEIVEPGPRDGDTIMLEVNSGYLPSFLEFAVGNPPEFKNIRYPIVLKQGLPYAIHPLLYENRR